jgi:hypothetical protein
MPVNRLVVLSPTGPGWLRVQQPCDVPRGQLARSRVHRPWKAVVARSRQAPPEKGDHHADSQGVSRR